MKTLSAALGFANFGISLKALLPAFRVCKFRDWFEETVTIYGLVGRLSQKPVGSENSGIGLRTFSVVFRVFQFIEETLTIFQG